MALYVIGDSHSIYVFAGVRDALIYYLDPITMHRVGRDGLASLMPPEIIFVSGDIALFSFGEIDCRNHIDRIAAETGKSSESVLVDLLDRYIAALSRFASSSRARVAVSSVIPPAIVGPGRQANARRQVVLRRQLNDDLRERCAKAGFAFVDVYEPLAHTDGTLPLRFTEDPTHTDPKPIAGIVARQVSIGLGIPFHPRRLWGDPWRYWARLSPGRRTRKLFSDPVRRVIRNIGRALNLDPNWRIENTP